MSVEAKLKAALESFGDPVENGVYHGSAERYYTFNVATAGDLYANDAPQCERYLIQVHLYAPLPFNFVKRRAATCRALFDSGFQWPSVTDASDDAGRHLVFETECVEGVQADEV